MFTFFSDEKDSGRDGKNLEINIKLYLGLSLHLSQQGRTDLRYKHRCYEIKSGGGELFNAGEKQIRGSSTVIFIPVIDMEKDITEQNGYVIDRHAFINALDSVGMIRRKVRSNGSEAVSIQTFWNKKQNKPHGRGLDKIREALSVAEEEGTAEPFSTWIYNLAVRRDVEQMYKDYMEWKEKKTAEESAEN